MRGIFVVGTSTGVGKTVVCAGLAWALRRRKIDVGIMKPFATGNRIFSKKHRSSDTALLAEAAQVKETDVELNPVFYRKAASPLVAAELTNKPLPLIEDVLVSLETLAARHEFIIVEGIGGVLVPLTSQHYLVDFARLSSLPVLIVTTPHLGTINHTLLTVEACTRRGLQIAGMVVNMMPKKPNPVEESVPKTLSRLSNVPVLGVIQRLRKPDYFSVGKSVENNLDLEALLSLQ